MSEQAETDTLIEPQATEEPTSLMDSAESTLGEGEYFLTNGIKGIGDRPEYYLHDRYDSIAEQAKAYPELEKKFGAFKGSPKDGYSMPEGIEKDDGLMEELIKFGTDSNMSQDSFDQAWELLTTQNDAADQISSEAEMAKLGDRGEERIKHIEQFMKNTLDSDQYERLRYGVSTALQVELIETLINKTAPAKLPMDGNVQPGGVTWDDIQTEMFKKDDNGNMLRSVDQRHEEKIQAMMKEWGGDRPDVQTYG
jgi:hypothetical protein